MERIVIRPIDDVGETPCWNCGRAIERTRGHLAARYLYRGDQRYTALIEDWFECECGAYQNVRCLNEITIQKLGRNGAEKA